jgi:hypothetical protein
LTGKKKPTNASGYTGGNDSQSTSQKANNTVSVPTTLSGAYLSDKDKNKNKAIMDGIMDGIRNLNKGGK